MIRNVEKPILQYKHDRTNIQWLPHSAHKRWHSHWVHDTTHVDFDDCTLFLCLFGRTLSNNCDIIQSISNNHNSTSEGLSFGEELGENIKLHIWVEFLISGGIGRTYLPEKHHVPLFLSWENDIISTHLRIIHNYRTNQSESTIVAVEPSPLTFYISRLTSSL